MQHLYMLLGFGETNMLHSLTKLTITATDESALQLVVHSASSMNS